MAGPECCIPAPAAGAQQGGCLGKEETLGPFLSYLTSHTSPIAAVILISDAFGFGTPLLRKLADKVASAGYFVVVPDCLDNDPFVLSDTDDLAARISDWKKRHPPSDAAEKCKHVVSTLNEKGFKSVGAVGFCWGAKVVVELAKGDWLRAAVLAHPSLVAAEDIQDVKCPIAILGAEVDHSTPPALVKQFAEILERKLEIQSFAHVYPGVSHGWVIRYDPNNQKEAASAEEAHGKILQWFGELLP